MANQIINIGIYLGLLAQLNKLARHNRQGSFRTKERYYEAMKRFCAFLADASRLQKLTRPAARTRRRRQGYRQPYTARAARIPGSIRRR